MTNNQGEVSQQEEFGVMDALALNQDGDLLVGGYCSQRSRENVPGTNDVIDTCLDRSFIVWGLPDGGLRQTISTGQTSKIRSLAFKPDDKNTLAAGFQDASIQLWDIEQGRASGLPLIGMGGPVTSLAFHQDGDVLASGSENKLIALWNMSPPQLIGDPFTGADGEITGLAFNLDNSLLFSGTDEGTIAKWDITEWKQLACELAGRNLTRAELEQFFPNQPYRATCEQYPVQTPESNASLPPATPAPTAGGTATPSP